MHRHLAACAAPLAILVACSSGPTPPRSDPTAASPPPSSASATSATSATSPTSATPEATKSAASGGNGAPKKDGFIAMPGAPDPLACTTDADCTYGQTYDASGCCGTFRDMAATAQSKAYLKFTTDWRSAHCEGHACPSPPVPTEPPACLFEVKCSAEKVCRNACA